MKDALFCTAKNKIRIAVLWKDGFPHMLNT